MLKLSEKITYYGTIIFDIFFLNILWLIGSLPVFTIGQSTTAVYFVIGKIIRKEEYSVFSDFCRSYKGNFIQGIFLSIILIGAINIVVVNINLLFADTFSSLLFIIIFILALMALSYYLYAAALLSRYNIKTVNLFILANYISCTNLIKSAVSLSLLFLAAYFTYYIPFLFLVCSFSGFSFIHYLLIKNLVDTDWNKYWGKGDQ